MCKNLWTIDPIVITMDEDIHSHSTQKWNSWCSLFPTSTQLKNSWPTLGKNSAVLWPFSSPSMWASPMCFPYAMNIRESQKEGAKLTAIIAAQMAE
jgi:hypothetical protein